MPVFTKTAAEIFDPLDAQGRPRGAAMEDCRVWGTELEAAITASAVATGVWTPVLTFVTPGNLVVAYSNQTGSYVKIGPLVFLEFDVRTSTFTHTTASGVFQLTGSPFTSVANMSGSLRWRGITRANFTDVVTAMNGANLQLNMSGSGQTTSNLTVADFPTGGTVDLRGVAMFRVS